MTLIQVVGWIVLALVLALAAVTVPSGVKAGRRPGILSNCTFLNSSSSKNLSNTKESKYLISSGFLNRVFKVVTS